MSDVSQSPVDAAAGEATTASRGRRADIQGLRAVAVGMVVAFHAGLALPGGFAGVDVFFVISGFVITSMLWGRLSRTGTVSFSSFYVRRIRRLLPALAVLVNLVYLRGGKSSNTTVALGELPGSDEAKVAESGRIGLGLQTLTPEIAQSLGLPNNTKGAVITDVVDGSPAARAGLKEGEVIVEVDRKPVSSVEDAAAALHAQKQGGHLIRVRGPSGVRFVTVN